MSVQAESPRVLGKIERFDSQVDSLLGPDAKLEILADGFTWTEGPVWVGKPDTGHLLFSDIPRNSIFKWTPKGGIELFMNPSGYTGVTYYGLEPGSNGLLLDDQGNLVLCEHGDRRVSVLTQGEANALWQITIKESVSTVPTMLSSKATAISISPIPLMGCQLEKTIRAANWIISASTESPRKTAA